jgi:uncharacterized protein YrrD
MLKNFDEITDYTLSASDGDVGKVQDLFFDDEDWVIRYLVVQTGSWLASRKVLISPYSLGEADGAHKTLGVNLSQQQVRGSPDVDTDMPVSRQHETAYADYYRYPYYWEGSGFWGDGLYFPTLMAPDFPGGGPLGRVEARLDPDFVRAEASRHTSDDPHLRSCKAVVGYQVHATDGEMGPITGMLVDEATWAIRYVVIETGHWWKGHKVLVPPQWITGVSWLDSQVTINLRQETIRNSPRYDSDTALNREQETALYQHYGRPNYWEREFQREALET